MKDVWGKTIRHPPAENGEVNNNAHASVASVVERLIATDINSSNSETSLAAKSFDSFETSAGKSSAGEGSSMKMVQKDVDEQEFQEECSTDIVGDKVLDHLDEHSRPHTQKQVSPDEPDHSFQSEADIMRQINSLRITAGNRERSLVEEAAAAASARTIDGYICKQQHLARTFVSSDGLSCLRELLDSSSERVAVPCLDLLLTVVQANTDNLIESCSLGIIPAALRFSSRQYSYSLRSRAAEYGYLLATLSQGSAEFLVACQGIPFLLSLVDDKLENHEQFSLANSAMCTFWNLLRRIVLSNKVITVNQYFRLMAHHGLPQKIVKVLPWALKKASEFGRTCTTSEDVVNSSNESVSEDQSSIPVTDNINISKEDEDILKLIESLVNMFCALSKGDKVVKSKCCVKDTINTLFGLSVRMPTYLQHKVAQAVKILSTEESVLAALEEANAIAYAAAQLPREDCPDIQRNALLIFKNLCQLSKPRQEKAAQLGVIPWFCRLSIHPPGLGGVQDSGNLENDAISLLCGMAHAGPKPRAELWKSGAIDVMLQTLKDEAHQASIMEALSSWLDAEVPRIEPKLLEDAAITRMVLLLPSGNPISHTALERLPSIVSPLSRIVGRSQKIGHAMTLAGLASRITELMNEAYPPSTLALLELLKILYEIEPQPKEFLSRNRVIPALKKLTSGGNAEDQVLVQMQANKLLTAFSVNTVI